jgi:hypothetical protein
VEKVDMSKYLRSTLLAGAASVGLTFGAQAAYVLDIQELNTSVPIVGATGSGSINYDDLNFVSFSVVNSTVIDAGTGQFNLVSQFTQVDGTQVYSGFAGPSLVLEPAFSNGHMFLMVPLLQ